MNYMLSRRRAWDRCERRTGKREVVDRRGEFMPGETVVKLYNCKRPDGYVTVAVQGLAQSRRSIVR